ncbi:hypothetical protein QZH41_016496, partial [Actinostola sp. cb2023]
LDHPSSHQLRSAANRCFFALDMDKAIDYVTKRCHPCAVLMIKKTLMSLIEKSTNPPPERHPGHSHSHTKRLHTIPWLICAGMWMQRDQFSNHQIPLSDQEYSSNMTYATRITLTVKSLRPPKESH